MSQFSSQIDLSVVVINRETLPKAKVAIISPYFERGDVVERTLRSISQQSYRDFIAVIWDDCSSDHTWAEMVRVAESLGDKRFFIFRNETNLGLTAGLNAVFNVLDTEYVAIVGSGDVCLLRRIEKQLAALEADPAASFCATASVSVDEVTGARFFDDAFDRSKIVFDDLRGSVPFTHGSVMYRTKAVKQVGLYEPTFKWCADWDIFLRLLSRGHAVYVEEVLYERFAMLDGVSFNPRKSMLQMEYKYLAKRLINKTLEERTAILMEARKDLTRSVACCASDIARDLRKRQVKLLLLGRRPQARELSRLINEKYGDNRFMGLVGSLAFMAGFFPNGASVFIRICRRLAILLESRRGPKADVAQS